MSLESHSASATIAGFFFQLERALLYLSKAKEGDFIGIETLDDVSIISNDGNLILEQDKHSLQEKSTPLSDKSKNLWNTLSIWITALKNGELDINRTTFFLVTNKEKTKQYIVDKISDATTEESIRSVINELKNISEDLPDTVKKYSNIVLHKDNTDHLFELIKKTTFIDGKKSTQSQIIEEIGRSLQIPQDLIEKKTQIINGLLGWIQLQLMTAWYDKRPAWISRDSFVDQFHAQLNSINRLSIQARVANLIQVSDEQVNKKKDALFVKQIQLVSDHEPLSIRAINDYIRYRTEKIRLSLDGYVTEQDWLDFSNNLFDRWDFISTNYKARNPYEDEKKLGLEILIKTIDHKENLAGAQTEQQYLTTGELHSLANCMKIGWHPRYKELLK